MSDTRIPIAECHRHTWEQYLRGRLRRRQLSNQAAGGPTRRSASADDALLRAAFDGERGPAFPTDAELEEAVRRYFPEG